MPGLPILVLNSGSSSIKFSMYEAAGEARHKLMEGAVDGIGGGQGKFRIKDSDDKKIVDQSPHVPDLASAFKLVEDALLSAEKHSGRGKTWPHPAAIGHRVVCGGPTITENQRVTPELIEELKRYIHFAPLHNPVALFIMREMSKLFPDVPSFICLDSYFHRSLPEVTRRLPIPSQYTEMGVQRFGAHGISYESIIAHLEPNLPSRLIVAHLGNGASICAIRDGRSIDTSMGLTPTGGLISGTRTGDIDPGALIFILRELSKSSADSKHAADELEDVVSKQAGLIGVSKATNGMRELREAIAAGNRDARLAVDQFIYSIRKFIGAYIAVLGGLDMLVFTGGIGVNDAASRAEVCSGLECFGIVLDPQRNNSHSEATISSGNSPVTVRVIPPEEDLIMVDHVCRLIAESSH